MTTTAARILIVDDERGIRRFLSTSLTANGYSVTEAATGQEAIVAAAQQRPDVVVLDLGLPDMDGTDVVRSLREWSQGPILILSVRDQERDKIEALDAGADDYLTKPFGVGELLARLRAMLRRASHPEGQSTFESGALRVDLAYRLVTVNGVAVQLTPTEYSLLRLLVTHAGKVLTHRQLLREVWGIGYEEEMHLLRVNMSNLRRKIESEPGRPRHIITEPGVGYRLRIE